MRSRLFVISALVAVGLLGVIGAAGATIASEASQGGRPLDATLSPENQLPQLGPPRVSVLLGEEVVRIVSSRVVEGQRSAAVGISRIEPDGDERDQVLR